MKTLQTPISTTYEVKQSKFIAYLVPYNEFETMLSRLKSEHPKARHFVTAYRYLNEHAQIVEGSSDDGEPKGTSGKPSLAVLAGNDLINAAVITVRYFGGTKLGTGGLVRAYTQAVSGALATASLREYIKKEEEEFSCEYRDVPRIEYLLHGYGVGELERKFGVFGVNWHVSGSDIALDRFFAAAGRLIKRTTGNF